jgi:hypothetical protein
MKMLKQFIQILIFCLVIGAAGAAAQTNEFTYQGKLSDSGTPSTTYDFEFRLCPSALVCSPLIQTIQRSGIAVTNGVFTVTLDFDAVHFSGSNRYLEIRVRRNSSESWTTLSPRQQITSAPYAVRSLNATSADNSLQLGGVAANQFVQTTDARLSDERNPLPNSPNYIQNSIAPQPSANFSISGSGTVGGTLSGGIVNAATQFNLGGNRVLSAAGSNNLYVGVGAGASNTTGNSNSFFGILAGEKNTDGVSNSFFGASAGNDNTTGGINAFFGTGAGGNNTTGSYNSIFGAFAGFDNTTGNNNSFFGRQAGFANTTGTGNTIIGYNANVGVGNLFNATAIGANSFVTQSNSLVLGSINGINGATISTNVGIGTTAPSRRLHVVGDGLFLGNMALFNGAALFSGISQEIDNNLINFGINTGREGTFLSSIPGYWLRADTRFGNRGFHFFKKAENTGTETELMTITDSGNVGIGASAPTFKLQVNDSSNAGLRVQTNTAGGTVASFGGSGVFAIDSPGFFGGRLLILENGRVGIGTGAPDQRLSVGGNASKSEGGGAWAVFSDERLKNVNGKFTRGLADLMRLNPIRFEYKPDNALGLKSAGEAIGFSAQEVERVVPEAVSRNANGFLQINNDPILWTMLNSVKEQQTQIEQQQKLIEQQQRQIEALKKLVCTANRKAEICREEQK